MSRGSSGKVLRVDARFSTLRRPECSPTTREDGDRADNKKSGSFVNSETESRFSSPSLVDLGAGIGTNSARMLFSLNLNRILSVFAYVRDCE